MESANLSDFARVLVFICLQCLLDKVWDLLYQLVEIHRGSPLCLARRQDVRQQISSVCQGRIAELGLGHDQRRLERELVSEKYIEVKDLGALLHAQR